MTPAQESEIFARLGGYSQFEAWLDEQLKQTTVFLMESSDPAMFHRAQGKARFITDLKKLLVHGKTLR